MPNPERKQISVFIAEDHPLMRTALVNLINKTDEYEVSFEASNGEQLLAYADRKGFPDLILLDISMPVMNGYETLSIIRKKCKAVKVVAISMYDDEQVMVRMKNLGANGYLSKTAKPEEMISTIKRVFTHGEYFNGKINKQSIDSNSDIYTITANLNKKELIFLKLACTDLSYKEIATEMHLSKYTIEDYRDSLFEKFDVTSRLALVLLAIKYKIVDLEYLTNPSCLKCRNN